MKGRAGKPPLLTLCLKILLFLLLPIALGQECDDKCMLPDCYCQPFRIPGNLRPENTPQMILLSFTGPVNPDTRDKLNEAFPDKYLNPNGCPIALTVFLSGKFSDYCQIHELYIRGFEIATQGFNVSYSGEWTQERWKEQIADHVPVLRRAAHIPEEHIQGIRAPLNRPGGNKQFKMMTEAGFRYDSTLLMGPTFFDIEYAERNMWPYTLYVPMDHKECSTPDCPTKSFPNIWEIPITRLLVDGSTPGCAYIDECGSVEDADIKDILDKNFQRSYGGNRAPMQINLQTRAFFNQRLMSDLDEFIKDVMQFDDVWFVTYQEALDWVQAPVPKRDVAGVFACPKRKYNTKCDEMARRAGDDDDDGSNSTNKIDPKDFRNPFHDVLDTGNLWIWQVSILVLLYYIIYRYDKMKMERAKLKEA